MSNSDLKKALERAGLTGVPDLGAGLQANCIPGCTDCITDCTVCVTWCDADCTGCQPGCTIHNQNPIET